VSERKANPVFRPLPRFMRSVHLERDFRDPEAVAGYILTDYAREALGRIGEGLRSNSARRSWRITGNYGAGKSSFALVLAHWFSDRRTLPKEIRRGLTGTPFPHALPNLLPILITGARQPIATALVRAISHGMQEATGLSDARAYPWCSGETNDDTPIVTDRQVMDCVTAAQKKIERQSRWKGILLLIDELGKFLEFAVLHPERQDIYVLQQLAEFSARSREQPFFVVGLTHQGFSDYAHDLSVVAQREWEKVAARFDEIVFDQPLEQFSTLVSAALNVRLSALPTGTGAVARKSMERAMDFGWFGTAPAKSLLLQNAAKIYPLDALALPVLARIFNRFGQNERSLFSFLLSNEPFGLQACADGKVRAGGFYGLAEVYDYVRHNLGQRLASQSYRSHWNHIDSVVQSFPAESNTEGQVLRTVGILNLLGSNEFVATEGVITTAVEASDPGVSPAAVRKALQNLTGKKRALYHRGTAGGYCLWPYTSVDIEKAYQDALQTVPAAVHVSQRIETYLERRPVVARRHYIQTGNLRYFDVRHVSVKDLETAIEKRIADADGQVLTILCETEEERLVALQFAKQPTVAARPDILLAIPPPLSCLGGLVAEAERWECVARNTPELRNDRYAAEEVSRQAAAARIALQKRIQAFLGLHEFAKQTNLVFYHKGRPLLVASGRELLHQLSNICDSIYPAAPHVRNELVNRRQLSSAAAAARMRLIERMLSQPGAEFMGMDPGKKPPEMSMYLSVLRAAGIHRRTADGWTIEEPDPANDACKVLPSFRYIAAVLNRTPDARVPVTALIEELGQPPYGVRDGLIPIFLAAFLVSHQSQVALYEKGTFLPSVDAPSFLRLTKAPETFEMQWCAIEGIRSDLLKRLSSLLVKTTPSREKLAVLDIVRPICTFVAALPEYTRNTKRLAKETVAARTEILAARDPVRLLFHALPTACGFAPFLSAKETQSNADQFAKRLGALLDELKVAYSELRSRIKTQIESAFNLSGAHLQFRQEVAARSQRLVLAGTEPRLKAFCIRLSDTNLSEGDWLDSVGSFVASKPPAKWTDQDEDLFSQEVAALAGRFCRTEGMLFSGEGSDRKGIGIRVTLTKGDGSERDQVVYMGTRDQEKVRSVKAKIEDLIRGDENIGVAAAAEVLWRHLRGKDWNHDGQN